MKFIKYLFLILFLFGFNQIKAEDRNNRLDILFKELKIKMIQ